MDCLSNNTAKNLGLAIFLVLLAGLPRLFFANPVLYDGDPVHYFLGAENLLRHGSYLVEGNPGIYPIGYSLLTVPFLLIWPNEMAPVAVSVLFSCASILLLFDIGRRLFNPAAGAIAALLLGFAEAFFFVSLNVLSDASALFFQLLAVRFLYGFPEHRAGWTLFAFSALVGAATLIRISNVVLLLFPAFIVLSHKSRDSILNDYRNRLRPVGLTLATSALGFLIVVSPALLHNLQNWSTLSLPSPPYSDSAAGLFSFDPLHTGANVARIIYRLFLTGDFYAPAGGVALLIGAVALWKGERRNLLTFLALWAGITLIPLLAFYIKPRFLIPLMPPVFLLMATGSLAVSHILLTPLASKPFTGRWHNTLTISIALLIAAPSLAQSFRLAEFSRAESGAMKAAFEWVRDSTTDDTVILTQSPYVGHFNVYEATGIDIWASAYYSRRHTVSLDEDWQAVLSDTSAPVVIIINKYWTNAPNKLMMHAEENVSAWEQIRDEYSLALRKTISAAKPSKWLWKLTALTMHPDRSFVPQNRFMIFEVRGRLHQNHTHAAIDHGK